MFRKRSLQFWSFPKGFSHFWLCLPHYPESSCSYKFAVKHHCRYGLDKHSNIFFYATGLYATQKSRKLQTNLAARLPLWPPWCGWRCRNWSRGGWSEGRPSCSEWKHCGALFCRNAGGCHAAVRTSDSSPRSERTACNQKRSEFTENQHHPWFGGVAQWLGRKSLVGGLPGIAGMWPLRGSSVRYESANQANSAFHLFGIGKWGVIHVITWLTGWPLNGRPGLRMAVRRRSKSRGRGLSLRPIRPLCLWRTALLQLLLSLTALYKSYAFTHQST